MGIVAVGLSHKTAPIELREHLTVPSHRLGDALDRLKAIGEIQEAVVLSTCNRLEVYARPASERKPCLDSINKFFEGLYRHPRLNKSLYCHVGSDAVEHLFQVASGLDSMVVGETEVLGQVKSAYSFAQTHGATGKITNVLFQRALFVGKTVRTKTNISEGLSSVGSVAVRLAEKIFGDLKKQQVLLLGAGEIAEMTARHLLSQKVGGITVLNRTLSKAESLAKLLNGKAEKLDSLLSRTDIVLCSLSLEKPLIYREEIEKLMEERRGRSLYFIDLAVPRNVDPSVHEIDNVYVYNLDDLNGLVQENLNRRKVEIASANSIISEMTSQFYEWVVATLEGKYAALRHQVIPSAPDGT